MRASVFVMAMVLAVLSPLFGWGTDVQVRSGSCSAPSLATYGDLLFAGFGSTNGSTGYIYKSTNGGESWTLFKTLSSIVGNAGVSVTVSNTYVFAGYISSANATTVVRWTHGGGSQASVTPNPDPSHPDEFVHLADDGHCVYVTWSRSASSGDWDVMFARLTTGLVVEQTGRVAGGFPDYSWYFRPRIAWVSSGSSTILLVTSENSDDASIYYWRSTDEGNSWTDRAQLGSSGNYADISAFFWDYVTIAWHTAGSSKFQYKYSTNGGTTWSSTGGSEYDSYSPMYPSVCQPNQPGPGRFVFEKGGGDKRVRYADGTSVAIVSDAAASNPTMPAVTTCDGGVLWCTSSGVYFDAEDWEPSSVDEANAISAVRQTSLLGSFPEPFSMRACVKLALARDSRVVLHFYDSRGNELARIQNRLCAGRHNVVWNACARDGTTLPAGIYFCRMEAGDYVGSIRMSKTR